MSPAATARLLCGLCIGRHGQEFLATMFAAKVKCLSIAVRVNSGGFVNGHSADWILGGGLGIVHGCGRLLVYQASRPVFEGRFESLEIVLFHAGSLIPATRTSFLFTNS